MPYEPLHHKYRPQTFAELVGQGAIASTLSNALQQRRIAPAYLFTGPRGTGKTSSARILSKSLNCIASNDPTPQPCGMCETCQAIARGSALDVIEIDAASNTGVDNIRELIERAQFAPVQCRYKVYVIDEVHMLSTAAFNALLKTLEEPPDRVVFVLATTDPQKVLPTIISRCQRFDFRRIPLGEMVEHLTAIAAQESIDIAPDAVQLVAQISQGGLRDAESLLDQLSLLDGQITVERVWDLVGAVPERDLLALVQAIAQDDAAAVLDRARHLMDRGREPLIVLQNLASFYRDLLIAKTSPDRNDLVALTPVTWTELCEFARSLDIALILAGQQRLRASEAQVKNTTQPRLWLEVTLMGLLPSAVQPSFLSGNAERSMAPRSDRPAPPAATPTAPAGNVSLARSPSAVSQSTHEPIQASHSAASNGHHAEVKTQKPVAETSAESAAIAPRDPATDSSPPLQPNTNGKNHAVVEPEVVEPEVVAHSPQDLSSVWQDVIAHLRPPGTQALLRQQGRLLSYDGHQARVSIGSQPLLKMAKERLPNLEAAFEQAFNAKVKVSLEVAESQPEPTAADTNSPHPELSFHSPSPERRHDDAHSAHSSSTDYRVHETSSSASYRAAPISPTPSKAQPAAPAEVGKVDISQPAAHAEDSATAQVGWQAEDEVSKAAKSLAQMFNGQVVNLDDNISFGSSLESLDLSQFGGDLDDDGADLDDDVPF